MTLFSERIKEIRTDLGMNKAQFAEHICTSPSNITRYEQKDMNVSMSAIEEISKNLHISPSWLMGWSDDKYGLDQLDYNKVPIINRVKDGVPLLSPDNYEGFEIVNENRRADFCAIANDGDMCNAGINVGDMVFFKRQDKYQNNDLVGIIYNTAIFVRRYNKYGKTIVIQTEGFHKKQDKKELIFQDSATELIIAGKVSFVIAEVF